MGTGRAGIKPSETLEKKDLNSGIPLVAVGQELTF